MPSHVRASNVRHIVHTSCTSSPARPLHYVAAGVMLSRRHDAMDIVILLGWPFKPKAIIEDTNGLTVAAALRAESKWVAMALQVAVGDMWSSEDGECFDDMNAQVWQVHIGGSSGMLATLGSDAQAMASVGLTGSHLICSSMQAYFNVAMNQRSTDAEAAANVEVAADSVDSETTDGGGVRRGRIQLERGSSGYREQFMDRLWTTSGI